MVDNNTQPNLEQLVDAARAAEGAAYRFQPIKKDEDYNRGKFVVAHDELNNLRNYNEIIEKDPFNPGAREDLGTFLYGNPSFFQGFNPDDVRKSAKEAFKNGFEEMARYAERNRNDLLGLLDSEKMYGLMFSVSLYKNGDAEHDALVGLVNGVRGMASTAGAEDAAEKMRDAVLKKARSDAVPDWAKKLIKYFAGDPRFVQKVFSAEFVARQNIAKAAFAGENGIDGAKVRKVLESSIESAYEALRDSDNTDKEKKDIWEKSIRPYFGRLAELAYEVEDKKMSAEDNSEDAVKKRERKERRKARGLAA